MKPAKDGLQEKAVPIDQFFRKIVLIWSSSVTWSARSTTTPSLTTTIGSNFSSTSPASTLCDDLQRPVCGEERPVCRPEFEEVGWGAVRRVSPALDPGRDQWWNAIPCCAWPAARLGSWLSALPVTI